MSLCISISNYALAENAAIIYVIMLFAGSNWLSFFPSKELMHQAYTIIDNQSPQ